jgi:16S rRNA (guanine966-N2)-methyltransferase
MRIIGGRARGRLLRAPGGARTRPTSDRVREALFSAVEARIGLEGAAVLDLFAGSGALGLEALSRGAASAVFVDSSADAARAILDNSRRIGLERGCRVIRGDAVRAASLLGGEGARFDLVLCDPPYGDDPAPALGALVGAGLLSEAGLLVLERPSREPGGSLLVPGALSLLVERRYGDTALLFFSGGRAPGGPSDGT